MADDKKDEKKESLTRILSRMTNLSCPSLSILLNPILFRSQANSLASVLVLNEIFNSINFL